MANLEQIARLAEIDGALLVDKPAGIAAHEVEKAVKQRFNLVKTGHGATLETNASGLLVLLVGNGTKIANDLAGADKTGSAVLRLGVETDTGDLNGRILAERPVAGVTRAVCDAALADFRGDIFQVPPAFSAVKTHGRATYEVIRTAEESDRTPHLVHVYRLTVTEFVPPSLSLEVSCTRGVSVRALAHDLGAVFGCGAALESFRRIADGRFRLADAISFVELLKLPPADFMRRVIPVPQAAR